MIPFPNYYISTPTIPKKTNTMTNHNNRLNKIWPPTLFTGGRGGGGGGGVDELATVKAAAWAWYQRNEGKPMMREFDLTTRTSRTLLPSRYKLEANKNMMMVLSKTRVSKSHNDNKHLFRGDQETKVSSSTLLDPYEIKSISKRIDEGSLHNVLGHDHHYYDHGLLQKKVEYDDSKKVKVSMINLWRGMIMMAPRPFCGRRDDVDLGAHRLGPRTLKVRPKRVNNL
ncbi:unnamed protein product [Cochlearia groenlandica]